MSTQNKSMDIKVGIFVIIGIVLSCIALIMVGGTTSIFESRINYRIVMPHVEGLSMGSLVKVAGFRVGQISNMNILDDGQVEIRIDIQKRYGKFIKQDSLAELGTLGVLGDKYLNITVGNPSSPLIESGGSIKVEKTKEFKDYISKGDHLLENLNSSLASIESILSSIKQEGRADSLAKNLTSLSSQLQAASKDLPSVSKDLQVSAGHLKNILSKVDRGDGMIGALINDQSLYDDLKSLLGGANRNRVLKYFIKKSVEDARSVRQEQEKQAQQ